MGLFVEDVYSVIGCGAARMVCGSKGRLDAEFATLLAATINMCGVTCTYELV